MRRNPEASTNWRCRWLRGDTLLAHPGICYRNSSSADEPLEISEHRIRPERAFV